MSPEIIAIVVTAVIQLVVGITGIVILGRMARENGRMLEQINGVDAAVFLQGRQMKEVLEEIRRSLASTSARPPER